MNDTLKLTDNQVLTRAHDLLPEHLPLTADGSCCTTDDLLNVLLGIAVNRGTLEAVCTDWAAAPDPETMRRYLNEQLCVEDLPNLEQRLNAALRAEIPRRARGQTGTGGDRGRGSVGTGGQRVADPDQRGPALYRQAHHHRHAGPDLRPLKQRCAATRLER